MSKSVTMDVSDEEDDWDSESGEDDGDGPGCEDEVEEVIQSTSTTGGSVKSILFLSERNEDKENKVFLETRTRKTRFSFQKPFQKKPFQNKVFLSKTFSKIEYVGNTCSHT